MNFTIKKIKWAYFVIIHILMVSRFALADFQFQKKILDQSSRPSVQQIENIIRMNPDGLPALKKRGDLPVIEKVNYYPELHNAFPYWFEEIKSEAPFMIAQFEKTFPGATWAFLGRDTAILADLFEAFYTSLGQSGRVVRIGMSRPTLVDLTDDLAVRFLEQNGLDLHSFSHPFILIDSISSGGGTQGRKLIQAVYSEYAKKFGSVSELLSYFNFIGMEGCNTPRDMKRIPIQNASLLLPTEVSYYKRNENSFLDSGKFLSKLGSEHQVITYRGNRWKGGAEGIAQAGYTHFTGAWHGPFGPIYSFNNGDLAVYRNELPFDTYSIRQIREAQLLFQASVITLAKSEDFKLAVMSESKKLEYEFPLSRPRYVHFWEDEYSLCLKGVKKLDDALACTDEVKTATTWRFDSSSAGAILKSWLKASQAPKFTLLELDQLFEYNQIDSQSDSEKRFKFEVIFGNVDTFEELVQLLNRDNFRYFVSFLRKSENLFSKLHVSPNQINTIINISPEIQYYREEILIAWFKSFDGKITREEYKALLKPSGSNISKEYFKEKQKFKLRHREVLSSWDVRKWLF